MPILGVHAQEIQVLLHFEFSVPARFKIKSFRQFVLNGLQNSYLHVQLTVTHNFDREAPQWINYFDLSTKKSMHSIQTKLYYYLSPNHRFQKSLWELTWKEPRNQAKIHFSYFISKNCIFCQLELYLVWLSTIDESQNRARIFCTL